MDQFSQMLVESQFWKAYSHSVLQTTQQSNCMSHFSCHWDRIIRHSDTDCRYDSSLLHLKRKKNIFKASVLIEKPAILIGGFKGGHQGPWVQILSFSCSFSGNFWPNNRLAPPPWGLVPPPLANPGSATDAWSIFSELFNTRVKPLDQSMRWEQAWITYFHSCSLCIREDIHSFHHCDTILRSSIPRLQYKVGFQLQYGKMSVTFRYL